MHTNIKASATDDEFLELKGVLETQVHNRQGRNNDKKQMPHENLLILVMTRKHGLNMITSTVHSSLEDDGKHPLSSIFDCLAVHIDGCTLACPKSFQARDEMKLCIEE